jgi:hypothetical protein
MDKIKEFINNITLEELEVEKKTEDTEDTEKGSTARSGEDKLSIIKEILRSHKLTEDIAENDTGAILALLSLLPDESKAEFVSMLMLVVPQVWIVRTYSQYGLSDIKPMKEDEDTITAFATLCTAVSLTDKVLGDTSKASVLWLAFIDMCLVNVEYGADEIVFEMLNLMPDNIFGDLCEDFIHNLDKLDNRG